MKDHDSVPPAENNENPQAQENKTDEELINEITEEFKQIEEEGNSESENKDENPEWDGSQSEFVEDDDSAEYEIPETGIKLSYVITAEEMYKCLYHSNLFKTKGARAIIQSIILGFASLIFFITYFTTDTEYDTYNLFFAVICLVMIAVIYTVPHFHMKSMAKMMADGKTIQVEVYPTHIDIGRDDGEWSVELDGKAEISEFDNIFMIYTAKGQSFAIPERVIENEVYNDVKAILLSGTKPKEKE